MLTAQKDEIQGRRARRSPRTASRAGGKRMLRGRLTESRRKFKRIFSGGTAWADKKKALLAGSLQRLISSKDGVSDGT
jgi:hypothetical protein